MELRRVQYAEYQRLSDQYIEQRAVLEALADKNREEQNRLERLVARELDPEARQGYTERIERLIEQREADIRRTRESLAQLSQRIVNSDWQRRWSNTNPDELEWTLTWVPQRSQFQRRDYLEGTS